MQTTITFTNDNPNTIWNRLAHKLGRQPTAAEARDEVKRIMSDVTVDLAGKGRLRFQRKR